MRLIPKCVARPIEDVAAGSLVHISDSADWGVRGTTDHFFDLSSRRFRNRGGTVLDFGADYIISVDHTDSFFIAPWSGVRRSMHGSLCLFRGDESDIHAVLMGNDSFIDKLFLFDLKTGAAREWTRDDGEGIAFKQWQIWLPKQGVLTEFRSVFEHHGPDPAIEAEA